MTRPEYLGPLGRSMGVVEAGLNYTTCAVGVGLTDDQHLLRLHGRR